MVESESHGHIPVRRKDASPVRHPQSDETPEVPGIERLSHEPTVGPAKTSPMARVVNVIGQ